MKISKLSCLWHLLQEEDATYEVTLVPRPKILLDKMVNTDRFTARAHPENTSEITAAFDVAGLDQGLLPVGEACGI